MSENKNANKELLERLKKSLINFSNTSRNTKGISFCILGACLILIGLLISNYVPTPIQPHLSEMEKYAQTGMYSFLFLGGILFCLGLALFGGSNQKLCPRCKKDLEAFMKQKPKDYDKKIQEVFENGTKKENPE